MANSYKLSAQLTGHTDDVRAVQFRSNVCVLSGSRDGTVRVWTRTDPNSPDFTANVTAQAMSFVNSVVCIPKTEKMPQELFASGYQDGTIEVRPLSELVTPSHQVLVGHTKNVCTLDVAPNARWIVSGSWDGEARVWHLEKSRTDKILQHGNASPPASVWVVLTYNQSTVVTGCADGYIRVFDLRRRPIRPDSAEVEPTVLQRTPDVVRALCKVRNHRSGADLASASNDGVIRLWSEALQPKGEIHAHDTFIYSLACLSTGELVSSGEDRTARIWRGNSCVQTIAHPAVSVWSVAVCPDNDDIVTGASDKVARIFTRSPERSASAAELSEFAESVASAAELSKLAESVR